MNASRTSDQSYPRGESSFGEPSRPRIPFPKYSMAGMLLLTLIFSVLAAVASLVWEAQKREEDQTPLFIIAVLIAPMGLMLVVSAIRQILNLFND